MRGIWTGSESANQRFSESAKEQKANQRFNESAKEQKTNQRFNESAKEQKGESAIQRVSEEQKSKKANQRSLPGLLPAWPAHLLAQADVFLFQGEGCGG
jgi:hypothetical protein